MRMSSTPPGFSAYVSEHRFRLALLACALALAAMLTAVYGTVGTAEPPPSVARPPAP
jgi:hypothetical protein